MSDFNRRLNAARDFNRIVHGVKEDNTVDNHAGIRTKFVRLEELHPIAFPDDIKDGVSCGERVQLELKELGVTFDYTKYLDEPKPDIKQVGPEIEKSITENEAKVVEKPEIMRPKPGIDGYVIGKTKFYLYQDEIPLVENLIEFLTGAYGTAKQKADLLIETCRKNKRDDASIRELVQRCLTVAGYSPRTIISVLPKEFKDKDARLAGLKSAAKNMIRRRSTGINTNDNPIEDTEDPRREAQIVQTEGVNEEMEYYKQQVKDLEDKLRERDEHPQQPKPGRIRMKPSNWIIDVSDALGFEQELELEHDGFRVTNVRKITGIERRAMI